MKPSCANGPIILFLNRSGPQILWMWLYALPCSNSQNRPSGPWQRYILQIEQNRWCVCLRSEVVLYYEKTTAHPGLGLDLWKDFKSLVGGPILTITTRSSFLVKVELISSHESSISLFITMKVELSSFHGSTIILFISLFFFQNPNFFLLLYIQNQSRSKTK